MTLTRIVHLGWFVLLVGFLIGCSSTPPSGTGKSGGPATSPAIKPDELKASAQKFATEFLKAVRERKANAAQLTPEFKKVSAPAVYESDKAQGFSDAVADENLKLAATEVGDDVSIPAVSGSIAFAMAKSKTGGRTLLRLVKMGSDWKVDWLSIGRKGAPEDALSDANAPAQFTTQAFLDAVLTRKFPLAEGLLSDAGRMNLGKSVTDGKYNFGALKNKLEELFGGADKYLLTTASKDTVTVELPLARGKKTATFKLSVGAKVDQVEMK
jgi:hypothetical protein